MVGRGGIVAACSDSQSGGLGSNPNRDSKNKFLGRCVGRPYRLLPRAPNCLEMALIVPQPQDSRSAVSGGKQCCL